MMSQNNQNQNAEVDNTIKVEATLRKVLFPKDNKLAKNGNNFGITVWHVENVLKGEVIENETQWSSEAEITVKGEFLEELDSLAPYTLILTPVFTEKYGNQYNLEGITRVFDLEDDIGARKFLTTILSSRDVYELYKVYPSPIKIIAAHDVDALIKVKGIGDKRALKLIDRFEKNKDYSAVYINLSGSGLTQLFIQKIIKKYRNPDIINYKIKKDPYSLCREMEGVGFLTADKIALKQGFDPMGKERIQGLIYYRLSEWGEQGYSWVTSTDLLVEIYETFEGKENILKVYTDEAGNVIGNNIKDAIDGLIEQGVLVLEDSENRSERRIYLKKYYELEKNIAKHIKRLLDGENNFECNDWENQIRLQEDVQGYSFTDEQLAAVKLGIQKQVCMITGNAGTGKSSAVAGILAALHDYSFAQTALSGRAAARLEEITGSSGSTIHRLLGYNPALENPFVFCQKNPLPYSIIILDEISLIGGDIFLRLLEAIRTGSKLIMLGDMGQLEAVGSLNIAHDLFYSGVVPVMELTKIHRQAAKSGIITSAFAVRNQQQLTDYSQVDETFVIGELEDFVLDVINAKDKIPYRLANYYEECFNGDIVNHDVMKIQVIATQRERGASCVKALNELIQSRINPPSETTPELIISFSQESQWILRKNDKIMCVRNKYHIGDSLEENESQHYYDIFNGWFGIVSWVDDFNDIAGIYFPNINAVIPFDIPLIKELIVLGYCCTVHKCQGSSAPIIIAAIDFHTVPMLLTKEMVYTAITRAEKRCYLLAENAALRKAIVSTYVSTKQTFLKELLCKEND